MKFIEIIASVRPGAVFRSDKSDKWYTVDGNVIVTPTGCPAEIPIDSYLGQWEIYDKECNDVDKVVELYWCLNMSISAIAKDIGRSVPYVYLCLAKEMHDSREKYRLGYRAYEFIKSSGITVVRGHVKSERDMARYIIDKYTQDYPDEYASVDGMLVNRHTCLRDPDGKIDVDNEDRAIVNMAQTKNSYDLKYHRYGWRKQA